MSVEEQTSTQQTNGADGGTQGGDGGVIAGVTGAFSAAGSSAVNTATSAYNSAPDLGVTRTAQTAYQNAPDLGIGSRLGVNGTGDQGSSSEEQVSHGASHSSGGSTEASHGGAKAVQDAHEARLQKSRESGPSNEKRLNQSQSEIGVEDGIPTAAGAGTTLPQDSKVQDAFRSGAERHDAKVPQDYEAVDCPTKHAGDKDGKNVVPVGSSSSEASHREANERHSSQADDAERGDGDAESNRSGGSGKVKGFAHKVKNTVKGDLKLAGGIITSNAAKQQEGRDIKKGEV